MEGGREKDPSLRSFLLPGATFWSGLPLTPDPLRAPGLLVFPLLPEGL